MSTLQNWKTKLAYIGFGSLFGCLCTIIGMLASPVTAQRDRFGQIECTGLTVVDGGEVNVYDENGIGKVRLGIVGDGGAVSVLGMDGRPKVGLSVNEHGGLIGILSKDAKPKVDLGVDEHGGLVGIYDSEGNHHMTRLYHDVHGGRVGIFGRNGQFLASLGSDEHGGQVVVNGMDKQSGVRIVTDELGGRVDLFGGKDGKVQAALSINEHGGQAIVRGEGGQVDLGVHKMGGQIRVYEMYEKDTQVRASIGSNGDFASINLYPGLGTFPNVILMSGREFAPSAGVLSNGGSARLLIGEHGGEVLITRGSGENREVIRIPE